MRNFEKYAQAKIELEATEQQLTRMIEEKNKSREAKEHALKVAIAEHTLLEPIVKEMWEQEGYDNYMRVNRRHKKEKSRFISKFGDPGVLLSQSDRGAILLASGWYDSAIEQLRERLRNLNKTVRKFEDRFDADEAQKDNELRNLMNDIEGLMSNIGEVQKDD